MTEFSKTAAVSEKVEAAKAGSRPRENARRREMEASATAGWTRGRMILCVAVATAALGTAAGAPQDPAGARDPAPAERVRSFLARHCFECHGEEVQKKGLRLDSLEWSPGARDLFSTWVRVHDKLQAGEMPPKGKPQPAPAEREQVARALEAELHAADLERARAEGRVPLRRRTRAEVEYGLRDLLALPDLNIKYRLPEDNRAHGFDGVAEALDLSSVHMAKHLEAVEAALQEAFGPTPQPQTLKVRLSPPKEPNFQPTPPRGTESYPVLPRPDGEVVIFGREYHPFRPILTQFSAPVGGLYRLRISARGYQTDRPTAMAVLAAQGRFRTRISDTHVLGYFDVPPEKAKVIEFVARLERDDYLRVFPAALPALRLRLADRAGYKGPGLAIQWIDVEGPLVEGWPPKSYRQLFGDLPRAPIPPKDGPPEGATAPPVPRVATRTPELDAERLVSGFLPRAWGRPVSSGEVAPYAALARSWLERGAAFDEAVRVAYLAILASPEFMFLREATGRLDPFMVARRLASFLWRSVPDERLLELAREGQLNRPDPLRAEVERMLDDPKALRFTEDFVAQWLDLRLIGATMPDVELYPEFDDYLQFSMVRETQLFFQELLKKDLSVANLIHSDFTILNERLACHYGIEGVEGVEFRRAGLPPGSHRGGVLTQASVLKVTANGTVTSPVLRGVWILDRIVGQPADPPPPDVPALEPDIRGATNIREQLAKHRTSPTCAACHRKIDPYGFALESFDVIGGWRERYRSLGEGEPVKNGEGKPRVKYRHGAPVESGDVLPDGRRFSGIDELKELLLADGDQIVRCLATKLLTYATGAPPRFSDRRTIEGIVSRMRQKGGGLRSLVHEIVQSPAFLEK